MTTLQTVLLVLLVLGALYAVMAPPLVHAAIGLAVTSIILSIIIFQLKSPFAAVFELSVCAGLITVIFVSAISLTRHLTAEEERIHAARHMRRSLALPVIVVAAAAALYFSNIYPSLPKAFQSFPSMGVREALWEIRRLDLTGQLLLVLAGVFGVVVLFKGWVQQEERK